LAVNKVSQELYNANFKFDEDVHTRALERAWKNRDFEIDLYWKRAMYFWAFIASTFTGYLALIGSDKYAHSQASFVEYLLLCLGCLLSLAWVLVNRGSKTWQENWEAHIDLLEDKITGPLYKTVLFKSTHSVLNRSGFAGGS